MTTTMWANGNAATVQAPEHLDQLLHVGWGTDAYIKTGTVTWFHIPIPTGAPLNGDKMLLARAFLLVAFDNDERVVRIDAVHLWDGPTQIKEFDQRAWGGSHLFDRTVANTFELEKPYPIEAGVGISFCVNVSIMIDTAGGGVRGPVPLSIGGAGAEFVTRQSIIRRILESVLKLPLWLTGKT
jgi:hypothetical protein